MEKVKRRRREKRPRRHLIRNLPLKWSFMLYVVLCALVAILLSVSVAAWLGNMQSELYFQYYDALYPMKKTDDTDVLLSEDGVRVYSSYYARSIQFTPEDEQLYELYGTLSLISVPAVCLLCVVVTGLAFYNRKLKGPLLLIDKASARIAEGDLDFTIAYNNRNEMGRLATSFETMRAALQENERETWRLMESRKRLNAAFAHDLRTPLTVLKGYTEYLQTYVPQHRVPEEKLLSTIELMHAYVERLEGYTISMSMMQKLEEIRINPEPIAFGALCDLLRSAADMLRGPYALDFDCAGSGEIAVDPDTIVQVLENLVANAARYAKERIQVTFTRRPSVLQLTVSDDGPGFPDTVLKKGLVPYNHKRDEDVMSPHYGLGLYICSILCEKHGGELTLPQEAGSACITATFRQLKEQSE